MDDLKAFIAEWASHPMVSKLAIIAVGIAAIALINQLLRRALNRSINNTGNKYRARKALNLLSYIFMVSVVLFVFSDKLGNIGVALGVAGAGIAFALQEVIISLAGWLNIMIAGTVSVGQRVKIGGVKGDIVDIGVFSTTVMEMGEWVDGDLYNGRIVTLANSFVFNEHVHNYSAEYPFLWDEVKVPIRTESDFEFATTTFQEVLQEVCGDYARQSAQQWSTLSNKLRVEDARVEPMVTLTFDDNCITFTLRYIVDYKKRRMTKDRISRKLLKKIRGSEGKIEISTSTLEISKG